MLTLAEKLAIIKLQREADNTALVSSGLPNKGAMYHPKDWPLEGRVWFYKAGINNTDIELMRAFWNPDMQRVIIPFLDTHGNEQWIARDPHWNRNTARPKYLFNTGAHRGGGGMFGPLFPNHAGIVVVEDLLSAFRIQRDTSLIAIAAQGTSLDLGTVARIAKLNVPVFVWLDNDPGPTNWGQLGANILRRHFGRMGVSVTNIVAERDPKLYEPHVLRERLEV